MHRDKVAPRLWSVAEKERLSFVYAGFSKRLGEWLLEHGHMELAAPVVKKLVVRNELDEEANALLLRMYATGQDRTALETHYYAYSNLLKDELDVRPGNAISRLYERLQDTLDGRGTE
ncbi:MAG: bacterial transcriptional activator domain-containing protein [Cohnella sp.]|nr:bacterial transcriptional activator domain-containing protein [Cohnella sp.]